MENNGKYIDGYWQGKMINGYPASYFDNDKFQFPFEKKMKIQK